MYGDENLKSALICSKNCFAIFYIIQQETESLYVRGDGGKSREAASAGEN